MPPGAPMAPGFPGAPMAPGFFMGFGMPQGKGIYIFYKIFFLFL
jgi:hypothetical protein